MPPPTSDPRPNAAAMMPWMLGCGGLVSLLCAPVAWANPQGLVVVAGSATAVAAGPTLTLTLSDRAVLNWQSFNLAPGETTRFQQPNAASVVWNQVLDADPSHLFGNIQANGIVVLANRAGFWFGPDSVVKAASFVATTAGGPPADFASGGSWNISYAPPLASIINYGHIEAAKGGSVFLVAEKVVNQGVLMAPDGNIGLYAGKEVLVSDRPDGRGLSAKVSLPGGSVDNFGKLVADAGSIAIHAQVVNQSGIVQADSVRERNGVIELVASDLVTLGAGSQTSARGDSSTTASPGGSVIIQSGRAYRDDPTAKVSVAGGRGGGDGGFIEVSADDFPGIRAEVDGSAAAGSVAGRLLIDPDTIVIDATGTGSGRTGVIKPGDVPNQLRVSPSAFENFSQITLQARSTIDVNTLWNLADTTASGAKLTLEAGKDLRFGQSGGIIAGQGWSVDLTAGKDFTSGQVVPGTGSVLLNGGSSITAADGSVKIAAGQGRHGPARVHPHDRRRRHQRLRGRWIDQHRHTRRRLRLPFDRRRLRGRTGVGRHQHRGRRRRIADRGQGRGQPPADAGRHAQRRRQRRVRRRSGRRHRDRRRQRLRPLRRAERHREDHRGGPGRRGEPPACAQPG